MLLYLCENDFFWAYFSAIEQFFLQFLLVNNLQCLSLARDSNWSFKFEVKPRPDQKTFSSQNFKSCEKPGLSKARHDGAAGSQSSSNAPIRIPFENPQAAFVVHRCDDSDFVVSLEVEIEVIRPFLTLKISLKCWRPMARFIALIRIQCDYSLWLPWLNYSAKLY